VCLYIHASLSWCLSYCELSFRDHQGFESSTILCSVSLFVVTALEAMSHEAAMTLHLRSSSLLSVPWYALFYPNLWCPFSSLACVIRYMKTLLWRSYVESKCLIIVFWISSWLLMLGTFSCLFLNICVALVWMRSVYVFYGIAALLSSLLLVFIIGFCSNFWFCFLCYIFVRRRLNCRILIMVALRTKENFITWKRNQIRRII